MVTFLIRNGVESLSKVTVIVRCLVKDYLVGVCSGEGSKKSFRALHSPSYGSSDPSLPAQRVASASMFVPSLATYDKKYGGAMKLSSSSKVGIPLLRESSRHLRRDFLEKSKFQGGGCQKRHKTGRNG